MTRSIRMDMGRRRIEIRTPTTQKIPFSRLSIARTHIDSLPQTHIIVTFQVFIDPPLITRRNPNPQNNPRLNLGNSTCDNSTVKMWRRTVRLPTIDLINPILY